MVNQNDILADTSVLTFVVLCNIMGNERSVLAGLEVADEAIEVTEVWSMYPASFNSGNSSRLSVFVSPMFPGISKTNTPSLIQAGKNLMLHRHPCILKYVSTWSHAGRFHLATEEVRPLTQVLDQQTSLQVCLGLHSILKAIVFLHEKAKASHNNICRAAIYVSPDGSWKLGGFEFLCSFQNLSSSHLQQVRAHRYEKAVPPEEDSGSLSHPSCVDQYAFGVLVEEVLKKKSEGELNSLGEFRELARRQLQNNEPSLRPPLAPLLEHLFFDHQFLHIYSFLVELPLKNDAERQQFFRTLPSHLSNFPEEVVATQLVGLMLSRMVLLDNTAQEHLLPALLQPRMDVEDPSGSGIFTAGIFKQHVVPRLLQMLCVRDAQIRLLLLSHFHKFLPSFSADQLRLSVLPELLVGIKDTNDTLVSMTLRSLAELVPVLGAAVVIGGKRGKLFTDGRPKIHRSPMKDSRSQEKISVQNPVVSPVVETNNIDIVEYGCDLPERPSPDGGEAEETTASDKGDEEAWSDWDVSDTLGSNVDNLIDSAETQDDVGIESNAGNIHDVDSETSGFGLPDIMVLDIKNLASSTSKEEYDFFQDMEPIISKPQVVQVDHLDHHDDKESDDRNTSVTMNNGSLFDVTSAGAEGDAWDDDLGDWGIEETADVLTGKIDS